LARRQNFRGIGGGSSTPAAYTPASDTLALLWWDPTTLAAGAVAAWTDRIASVAVSQGTALAQPVYSASAIAGAYPGVTFAGGDDVLTGAGVGATLSGKTQLTVIFAATDAAATANRVLIEYGATGGNVVGGFSVLANAGVIDAFVTATTLCERTGPEDLTTRAVVSVVIDGTAGAAIKAIRKNGVALTLTGSNTITPTWTAANNSISFGNRAAGTLPWAGAMGDVIIRHSAALDSTLLLHERFIGARVGLTF
jgi:hypothetical protein